MFPPEHIGSEATISLLHMMKYAIRNHIRSILQEISPNDRRLRENRLLEHIQQLVVEKKIQQVAVYYPIHFEPDLDWGLITVDLFFPKLSAKGMVFVKARKKDCVRRDGVLVPEPRWDRPVLDYSLNTLMIVPGLAFNVQGYRVGYGKGFYDQFLSHVDRRHMQVFGVAFEEQLVAFDPEGHDVQLDALLVADAVATKILYPGV